jgi:carboxyl-terminal processing protease
MWQIRDEKGRAVMQKRFSLLTVTFLTVIALFAGSLLNNLFSGDSILDQANKFKDVLSITKKYYVEDVDSQKLTEAAIGGVLDELDPHSVYISASQLARVNEEFQGAFEGIGIEYQVLNDTLLVVSPIAGGPSEGVGIQGGDKIVRINDSSAIGITQEGVQKKLRGPKGTKVRVAVYRAGMKDLLDFEITRDKIPLYTVDAGFMVDGTTGYIRVNRFAATTYDELTEALTRLQGSGMKRLILDLRDNAGGYLEQAFKMADELMPKGKKIVYTKGRRAEFDDEYVSQGGKYPEIPLVVLVNNSSASASEIVAGAIQDWDRGIIVGESTFGKGLVQRQFELGDGSALRLTTARYYTPSGRLIQRPYGRDRNEYHLEAYARQESEGENVEHNAERDSTRPVFKTMGGRTVYGGGGITPDYIVKADRLTRYSVQLRSAQVFLQYADAYVEARGAELRETYGKESGKFADSFVITDAMLAEIRAIGEKKGVKFEQEQYDTDRRFIAAFAKATIARSMWGAEGASRVMLREDVQFKKALSLFPEAEKFAAGMSVIKER